MEPINRNPSPVFQTDEEIEELFNKTYDAARKTLLNWGSISALEITKSFQVSRDVSERVMEKIRIEFKASRLGNK
jgi:hypothetical protein